MEKSLVCVDTFWVKLRKFVGNIFKNKKCDKINTEKNVEDIASKSITNKVEPIIQSELKGSVNVITEEKILAEKLIQKQIDILSLTDEQIDSVIQYLKEESLRLDNELQKTKEHILKMQELLKK